MTKLLFVMTGTAYWTLKDGTRYATGYWAEEFAAPYKALTEAGHQVVVAPPGGVVPTVDMMSLRPDMAGSEAPAIVCHAPAAMLATRIHGVSPFAGYRVTAFTNEEENAVGLGPRARWLLEDELVDLGVDFVKDAMWKPCTVVDRNLFTGQNPASAAVLAERLLAALH